MAKQTKEDLQKIITKLQVELTHARSNDDYRTDEMQEKLYEAGIETRPSIMQKILDREATLFSSIKFMIEECEKETGREVDISIGAFKSNKTKVAYDIKTSSPITSHELL